MSTPEEAIPVKPARHRRKRDDELALIADTIRQTIQEGRDISVDRLASVAANLKTSVVVTDPALPDNPIVYANPAFTILTGYSEEEVLGRNCRLLQGPATDPKTVDRVRDAIERQEQTSVDLLNYRKDGAPFWNEVSISPILDARDQLRYFAGLQKDVTAPKRTRERLELRDAQFRAFFDRAGIGVSVTDITGHIQEVNAAYGAMLGYSPEELRGTNFADITHPDDIAQDTALLGEIARGERDHYDLEKRFLHRDGQVMWGHLTVSLVQQPDGIRRYVIAMVEDITGRKARLSRLAFQAHLLDAVNQAVVATQPDGTINYWNAAAERLYGWSEKEALGRSVMDLVVPDQSKDQIGAMLALVATGTSWSGELTLRRRDGSEFPAVVADSPVLDELRGQSSVKLLHPDDIETLRPFGERMFGGEEDQLSIEHRLVRKDGETVWVRLLLSRIPGDADTPDLGLAMLEDISERREVMEQRSELLEREQQVAEQLRQMERWRTSFLRIMAHELRTPLGQIVGFGDLLEAEVDKLSERSQRYFANLRAATSTLQSLVERSFDLLALYDDTASMERTSIATDFLVRTALDSIRSEAHSAGITLRMTGEAEQSLVHGDPQRLHQALAILLDNALKFTPPCGTITISVNGGPECVDISVIDSGSGVPAHMQEAIFGGTAENVLTRRQGGAGLGLLTARRIAELHAGTLKLQPSKRGAHFLLSLPRSQPSPANDMSVPQPQPAQ